MKAAATVPRRAPRTGRPVAWRFPERCPVPVRSAVLPLCDGFAVMAAALLTMPGWLAVGYPVAVLVALNAGGEYPRRICLRVSDEILRLAAFAAPPIVVLRDDVWGTPLIPLRPCGPRGSGRVAKRAFDLIIGAALLMACTPLLLLAVVVWLCGGPAILFRQIRITRAGGLMQITKFWAITPQNPDAEWTVSPDQCTRLGRLLRSTHLDELPQLLNLIRGQMSLIGPRRERPHFTLLEA